MTLFKRHKVRKGEHLSGIAAHYGLSSWEQIWNADENAKLRDKRDPNILHPGDVLRIPLCERRTVTAASGSKHTFKLNAPQVVLKLCLLEDADPEPVYEDADTDDTIELPQPIANAAYEIHIELDIVTGETDDEGRLECKLPVESKAVQLVLYPNTDDERVIDLEVGQLNPIDEMSGLEQRLGNLGFKDAENIKDEPQSALRCFQEVYGLDSTGELDESTRSKLLEIHES